jgi:hypothetical protein
LISDALTPVTTTVLTGSVDSGVACAHTEALLNTPAPTSEATDSFKAIGDVVVLISLLKVISSFMYYR